MPDRSGVFERFSSLLYRRVAPIQQVDRRLTIARRELLLAELGKVTEGDTIFIVTDVNTLNEVGEQPAEWALLQRHGLEPVSPRVWGGAVHIFARGEFKPSAKQLRPYVYGPDDLARAALQRVGFTNISEPRRAIELASLIQAFNSDEDASAVIVIYDEEPSAIVTNFVKQAQGRIQMLPSEPVDGGLDRRGGMVSMLIPYGAQDFYPELRNKTKVTLPVSSLVATAEPASKAPLPMLLTNVRKVNALTGLEGQLGQSLERTASTAYLLALYEYGETRCHREDPLSAAQFKTVLLNSYFADRENAYSVLGLLGHLLFEEGHGGGASDPANVFLEIARSERQLNDGRKPAKVIDWLLAQAKTSKRPHQQTVRHSPDVRAAFAGHVKPSDVERVKSELFVNTQEQLKTASANLDVAARCTALADARSRLITLASITLPAACGQPLPARGLWSRIDFEPFYYLAVADAIMTESGCGAK